MVYGLDEIVRAIRRIRKQDVSRFDEAFLVKTLNKRLSASGIQSAEDYAEHLSNNPEEADSFCNSLNVAYSEFFRNPLTFALLEQLILPSLIAKKKKAGRTELRVWSAGCAAGQEIYSIAILLDELIVGSESNVVPRLFATDHSSLELERARQGVYDLASVRNVPLKHIRRYFTAKGDSYKIVDRIKNRVDFSVFDLLDERSESPAASIYGDFDLVICSNLLFYYRPEVRQAILGRICRSLAANGILVTGEAERDIVSKQGGLRAVAPPSAIFQQIMRRGD